MVVVGHVKDLLLLSSQAIWILIRYDGVVHSFRLPVHVGKAHRAGHEDVVVSLAGIQTACLRIHIAQTVW